MNEGDLVARLVVLHWLYIQACMVIVLAMSRWQDAGTDRVQELRATATKPGVLQTLDFTRYE